MELLRQGQQGLGQQGDLLGVHGNFALLGAEHKPFHPHDVADIPLFKIRVPVLPHVVPFDVHLHPIGVIPQIHEAGLAHDAAAHHPSRDDHRLVFQLVEAFADLRVMGVNVEFSDGKGILPCLLQR